MQRSDKTLKNVSTKTKLLDNINNVDKSSLSKQSDSDNEFYPVTYHNKPWLFCFFGNKDGCTDAKYFGLKAEISAFASECYRFYTNGHSPKYRSVYGKKSTLVFGTYSPHYQFSDDDEAKGFITEKINKPITLSLLFEFLDLLEERTLYLSPSFHYSYHRELNKEDYFREKKKYLIRWHNNAISWIEADFDKMKDIMEADALKIIFINFLTTLKDDLLSALCDEPLQSNNIDNFSEKEMNDKLEHLSHLKIKEFYKEKICPIKLKLIGKYEKSLLDNGLPEIMAVGYALGEWSFKSRDIILDADNNHILKLDHERCLWEISCALLADLGIAIGKNSHHVINQQSISSQDIDAFPKRTNPPRFWPSSEDENSYPTWFLNLLNKNEFKQRAYVSLLAFAATPDHAMHSLAKLFFKPIYHEKISHHVVKRKNNLEKALKHSNVFAEFLLTTPQANVLTLFEAHNHRWKKEKYSDIHIDIENVNQYLTELSHYLELKKDRIDPSINHIYTIDFK